MDERRKNYSRTFSSAILSASAAIYNGRLLLTDLILAGGSDASYVMVYDGKDTTGRIKLKLTALTNDTKVASLISPILIEQGLYLYIGGTAPVITICFETDSPRLNNI